MKKILYAAIIALSFLIPVDRVDVVKLEPVEAVTIQKINNQIIVKTDTGDIGAGISAENAMDDLHKNAASVIYLDTAKYLLVAENVLPEIGTVSDRFKRSIEMCIWDGKGELDGVVKYLNVHGDLPKLWEWKLGKKLPQFISK